MYSIHLLLPNCCSYLLVVFDYSSDNLFCYCVLFARTAITCCFRWWQLPYYYVGIKMYDIVAGMKMLKSSYVLSKKSALELFPMLRGDKLVGAIVYYDGNIH